MIVRPATPADIPAVLPMVAATCALHESWDAAKYGFLPNPEQRYEKWLINQTTNDRSVFLVAEDKTPTEEQPGRIAGFLVATVEREVPIYRLKEYAFIHELWVEPEYRHAGIARQMVMLAIARFSEIKVQQIRLDTVAANDVARRLFADCGFRISTIEMLLELVDK